jgi:hypothetical protein
MRTQIVCARLPFHEACVIRRQAGERGITKSAHAANLLLRALNTQAKEELPNVVDQLHQAIDRLEQIMNGPNGEGLRVAMTQQNNAELRAFMIETLVLLRNFRRDDAQLALQIGRKLQRAVGDARVAGT